MDSLWPIVVPINDCNQHTKKFLADIWFGEDELCRFCCEFDGPEALLVLLDDYIKILKNEKDEDSNKEEMKTSHGTTGDAGLECLQLVIDVVLDGANSDEEKILCSGEDYCV